MHAATGRAGCVCVCLLKQAARGYACNHRQQGDVHVSTGSRVCAGNRRQQGVCRQPQFSDVCACNQVAGADQVTTGASLNPF